MLRCNVLPLCFGALILLTVCSIVTADQKGSVLKLFSVRTPIAPRANWLRGGNAPKDDVGIAQKPEGDSVEDEIDRVQTAITAVEAQIKICEQNLEYAKQSWTNSTSERDRMWWDGEVSALRDDKKQLRDKEKQLRDKEKQLRDDKKQLRDMTLQQAAAEPSLLDSKYWRVSHLPPPLHNSFVDIVSPPSSPSVPGIDNWSPPTGPGFDNGPQPSDPAGLGLKGPPFFSIDSVYLKDSGVSQEELVLFARSAFVEEFRFLHDCAVGSFSLGWIYGPPGTGKSAAAFGFATTLDRTNWDITWLHVTADMVQVVTFTDDVKRTSIVALSVCAAQLPRFLSKFSSKKHFIFLDGYRSNIQEHQAIASKCHLACLTEPQRLRFVRIASMATRGRHTTADDRLQGLKVLRIFSWTCDEYLAAVANDNIFNHVIGKLDACVLDKEASVVPDARNSSLENDGTENDIARVQNFRKELVTSKFKFAGGCSRYMFGYSTNETVTSILDAIQSRKFTLGYIDGSIGEQADSSLNRLICSYPGMGHTVRTCIVSDFAASVLAMKMGPNFVVNLAVNFRSCLNPAMDGWLFEMWFFAKLRHGGLTLTNRSDNSLVIWPESTVMNFEPNDYVPIPDDGTWLKPLKWNQGGYDAVFVNKTEGAVKIVQVARGDTHSLKLRFFKDLLEQISTQADGFEIKTMEIFCVVPIEKLIRFSIPQSGITSRASIKKYPGWGKGKVEDLVQYVGLEGWVVPGKPRVPQVPQFPRKTRRTR